MQAVLDKDSVGEDFVLVSVCESDTLSLSYSSLHTTTQKVMAKLGNRKIVDLAGGQLFKTLLA